MFKALICGGRAYFDYPVVKHSLDTLLGAIAKDQLLIVTGGAAGADQLGMKWAAQNRIKFITYYPDWDDLTTPPVFLKKRQSGVRYNSLAGFARNQKMLDVERPDVVIAFPGGPGTADMLARTKRAEIRYVCVEKIQEFDSSLNTT